MQICPDIQHSLRNLITRAVVINFPPLWGKQFSYGVETWRVTWKERWHHLGTCFKPLCDWEESVKRHIDPHSNKKFWIQSHPPISSLGASLSWRSSRNKIRRSLLYGSTGSLCNRKPSDNIAVHIVMVAPLWPWTSTAAHAQKWICEVLARLRAPWLSKINP